MLERVVVIPFGSSWRLKRICQGKLPWALRRLFIFFYNVYQSGCNSSIAWNSTFEGIPCFPHGIKGIFVSGDARIGKNCIIFQQVTIGSNTVLGSNGFGAPVLGDNCYIAAGAKIVGSVRVGNNVRIGANSVVYKDVPDNSVVVAGEQRVISRDAPLDNRFFSFHGRWVYFTDGGWADVTDSDTLAALENGKTGSGA